MANTTLFRPADEKWNLAIPVVFLVAILLGVQNPAKWFSAEISTGALIEELLVDVLLLNVTHNAFTVMMLVSFPEMREWLNRQKGGAKGFFRRAGLIFVGLSFLFGLGIAGFVPFFKELILPLSRFFPIQHALAQSLGLSLMYNGRSALLGEKTNKWVEKTERYLIWGLIALMVAAVWAATEFQIFGWTFQRLSFRTLFVASLLVSLLLMVISLLQPKSTRLNKTLFALRYPVWALSIQSPLAIWATRAIHGLEYLFVVRKMASKSRFTAWSAVAVYVLLATFLFAVLRVFYFSYASTTMDSATPTYDALLILASVSTAFSYVHYYLDRQLFLMRRKDNRELVAPLLRD